MKKLLILLALLLMPSIATSQTILSPRQGGTGIGSATLGQIGLCLKVADESPFRYELGSCGTGGGTGWASTTVPNANSIYFTGSEGVGIGTTSPDGKLSVTNGTQEVVMADGTYAIRSIGDVSLNGEINLNNNYITNGMQPGSSNFIGDGAGFGATSANFSNFFGENVASGATNASYSNFFGRNAGYSATSSSYSNFFGDEAGYLADAAENSNFFGTRAGYGAENASYSIFMGSNAGNIDGTVDSTFEHNFIVDQSLLTGGARSTATDIEDNALFFGKFAQFAVDQFLKINAKLRINGDVGVGTSTPYTTLAVEGDIAGHSFIADSETATSSIRNALSIGNYLSVGPNLYDGTYPLHDDTFLPDNYIADFVKDVDDYATVNLANQNSGSSASIDLTWNIDSSGLQNGVDFVDYADCGMNSSTYNVPFFGRQNVPKMWYCYNSDGPINFTAATTSLANSYIQFVTGGFNAEAMRIAGSGAVGIGSTTPYARLSVTNPLSTPSFIVEDTNNDQSPFFIDGIGRVGIGTSSPQVKFIVADNSGNLQTAFDNSNTSGLTSFSFQEAGTANAFVQYRGTTAAFQPNTLRVGTNVAGGQLVLNTGAGTERARIDTNGNFGIGTTNPDTKLHIAGLNPHITVGDGTNIEPFIFFNYPSNSGGDFTGRLVGVSQLSFGFNNLAAFGGSSGVSSGRTLYFYDRVGAAYFGAFNSSGDFYVGPSTSSYGLLIRKPTSGTTITALANGNVGIGTATPTSRLQINELTATSTISSTVVNGSTRSTTRGGRIILQDMAGGTCTEITTQSGSMISMAVACP